MSLADTLARLRAEAGDTPLLRVPEPTVSSLGVGWSVYESAPADSDYWPRGGVVAHVHPHAVPDPTTGELLDRYLLVHADEGKLCWASLTADQVSGPRRPNAMTIRGVCQVAARELAATKRKPDDERALELWSLGARLMAVLARPGTVAP